MQLGLLSHGQLTFDPFKPIILRGLPTEDASTLFAGNVVLNLSKATKISNVSVTLKSHATTYWPEGREASVLFGRHNANSALCTK